TRWASRADPNHAWCWLRAVSGTVDAASGRRLWKQSAEGRGPRLPRAPGPAGWKDACRCRRGDRYPPSHTYLGHFQIGCAWGTKPTALLTRRGEAIALALISACAQTGARRRRLLPRRPT